MEKLLENKLLKHYLIISYLLPRKWEKIRDIAKTTGLSEITIRQNISEINQYILPAKINSSQQRGIRLFLPPQQNGFFIFSKLYKQSLRFTLLEEIFINHYPNLTSLADKLFFSTSTLKRKIAELNQLLAPYSLSVDSSQLDIVGDERKICWFFFCFFTEKYGVSDEFMTSDTLDLFDEIYEEFFSY
ncbi:helix-turn-helix domain-containing protein [Enterococcus durans]|nr:helix-turn-helix domain-containing protein [Enterococcus durans]